MRRKPWTLPPCLIGCGRTLLDFPRRVGRGSESPAEPNWRSRGLQALLAERSSHKELAATCAPTRHEWRRPIYISLNADIIPAVLRFARLVREAVTITILCFCHASADTCAHKPCGVWDCAATYRQRLLSLYGLSSTLEIARLHRPSSHKRSLKSECGPILCFLKSTTAAIAMFRQRVQQSGHRRRPLAVHGLPRAGVILSEATEVESRNARNLPEDLLNFSCVFFLFHKKPKIFTCSQIYKLWSHPIRWTIW